jgi:hypothetical protein
MTRVVRLLLLAVVGFTVALWLSGSVLAFDKAAPPGAPAASTSTIAASCAIDEEVGRTLDLRDGDLLTVGGVRTLLLMRPFGDEASSDKTPSERIDNVDRLRTHPNGLIAFATRTKVLVWDVVRGTWRTVRGVTKGKTATDFQWVGDVVFDTLGRLYISDSGSNRLPTANDGRIYRCDSTTGSMTRIKGRSWRNPGRMSADSAGNLWVTEEKVAGGFFDHVYGVRLANSRSSGSQGARVTSVFKGSSFKADWMREWGGVPVKDGITMLFGNDSGLLSMTTRNDLKGAQLRTNCTTPLAEVRGVVADPLTDTVYTLRGSGKRREMELYATTLDPRTTTLADYSSSTRLIPVRPGGVAEPQGLMIFGFDALVAG